MSDQDFFFDDEEVAGSPDGGSKKPAPKGGSKKPEKKPVAIDESAEGVAFFEQLVPMQLVALIAVIALLVGVIGGFFLAPKPAPVAATLPAATGTGGMGGTSGNAPSLSEEQLQGEMPAGHPAVDSATEATVTP